MRTPSSPSSRALPADVTGNGTVRVSPLDMALAAGVVASGRWHQPSLVTGSAEPSAAGGSSLKKKIVSQLRALMTETVESGAARAARVRGVPLLGQVGTAQLAGHKGVRAIWFVGYRGGVAFAVLTFARSTSFDPAVAIAHRFAEALRPGM
jgi:cell division protein FtsI/penicillin-binding protein 2